MPQFDLAHFASQIFWLMLTFSVLYLVMARLTLPAIRETLQERKERVSSDIEKAEILKKEAEAARTDYTSALSNARIQAKKTVMEADESIKKEIHDRSARLDETLARQIREAELLVTKTRKEAMEKLAPVSAELAQYILEKISDKKVDASRVQGIVDLYVKENALSQNFGSDGKLERRAS